MKVDFSYLCLAYNTAEQRNRRTYLFSARLRHSRKAYREVVPDQKQQTFFLCHVHAFRWFGGIPEKVVPDNLKAAVITASFEEPLVNRVYQNLAIHYGFLISPCLPRKPEHKGGVENDIKYVKRNFLPIFLEQQKRLGRETPDSADVQPALDKWTGEVSENRLIKGIGRSPREIFEQEELSALKPLPLQRWDLLTPGTAKVQESWRIQFDCAFYSVPYEYIGKQVSVLANSTTVYVFYDYREIAIHERAKEPWAVQRRSEHAPPEAEKYLNTTREGLLRQARAVGASTELVVKALFGKKGVDGMQTVRALLRLGTSFGRQRLNDACRRAILYDTPEYRSVKAILNRNLDSVDCTEPIDSRGQRYFRFVRETGYFDPEKHHGREYHNG